MYNFCYAFTWGLVSGSVTGLELGIQNQRVPDSTVKQFLRVPGTHGTRTTRSNSSPGVRSAFRHLQPKVIQPYLYTALKTKTKDSIRFEALISNLLAE